MSSATVSLVLRSSTDAEFRAWGKAVSDQIKTSWTLTSDTGNDANGNGLINWATVLAPLAGSQVRGYEIFKSNDAAGSLVNIYMKIEYGSFSSAANQPQIWITFGWASDGSGNLTGTTSTRTGIHINLTATATSYNCNFGVGTGWLCMTFGTAANLNFYFSVERTKNSSLQDQNELLIFVSDTSSTGKSQVLGQSVAYAVQILNSQAGIIPPATNSVVSAVAGLGLCFGYRAGFTNPSMNIFSVHTGDLGASGTVALTTYGASHTYIINTGNASTVNNAPGAWGTAGYDMLSRFE
jgi:hypothetical protein